MKLAHNPSVQHWHLLGTSCLPVAMVGAKKQYEVDRLIDSW